MRYSLAALPGGMVKGMAALLWLFFASWTWPAQAGVNIAPAADVMSCNVPTHSSWRARYSSVPGSWKKPIAS